MDNAKALRSMDNVPRNHYRQIREQLRRRIARRLSFAHCVLDLGSGSCELDRFLATRNEQQVIGVDLSRDKFPSTRGDQVQCRQADAGNLHFVETGSTDAVLSTRALHEMKNPAEVLTEAHRVLQPGGIILIVDFPRNSLAQRLWNEDYYVPHEVTQMLTEAGFAGVESSLIARKQLIWAEGRKAGVAAREQSFRNATHKSDGG